MKAAAIALRIMNGESPATIPFEPLTSSKLQINLDAARKQGLTLSPSFVGRAQRVIGNN
jgi:ABC-type uncharacterized transport system substrate-binding protein